MATCLTFDKGEMIFHERDEANGFYMVEKGKIKVFKLSFEGKEQILHIYGPGHTFGEVPVFEGKNFPASSMALEKSKIIYLPRYKFVDLITQTPGLALNILADLSMRLRDFTIQIENLSLKEVPARLAAYILTLSKEQRNKTRVTLPISKAQLSNLIGTTPETISRILKKMMDAEYIDVQTKIIHIKNIQGLMELSESGSLA
ncbi:MAG: Crp/Fnr family transcriptional regulator [Proteobacteria bacterium]|nr:Crp/Fnr family transcriptional regulator [Pseudomonadota bacterium]MBU1390091.1 Crp/Fnr family transcriptional regulator [Pseudomonadota bacterium]MBU1544958.1 Crp/Fnr family transcriptional regulator [Pseudomonadota bacterium]MBU2482294.1 Crp/Fnr family transcriptional regulator [Pseudomonadota bacterium]